MFMGDFFYYYRETEQLNEPPQPRRRRRHIEPPKVEPPHICTQKMGVNNTMHIDKCLVYTKDMKSLPIDAKLHSAINQENETNAAEWCRYPIGKC